jgi:TolA-binding protein
MMLVKHAYLDDDKPANATEIFVRNYQELPDGDRAADSLFFLGVALTELNYNDRACLAFDELEEVYGSSLRSTIREQVPAARSAASCT